MGLFKKLVQKDSRTPEDLAAISLNQRLDFRPFNYSDVSITFLSHAFPTSPMFGGRAMLPSSRSAAEVRGALEQFVAGATDVDSLAGFVFDVASFPEFVEALNDLKKSTRGAASPKVLRTLESLKWNSQWERSLDEGRADRFVWDCLGEAGSRSATHSGLRHDGWDHRDSHAGIYADAARIGFMATAEPFGAQASPFGWRPDQAARDAVVGVAVIPSATVPNPLTVLPERHRSAVEDRCERLASRLRRMFGEREGKAVMPYTFSADPFGESLRTAARHGALLAAIGVDPSGCFVYEGYGEARRRLDSHELPWLT